MNTPQQTNKQTNKSASRTRFLIPHIILFPLFAVPPAGDVGKIVLPEGMQTVSFERCTGLTGTADSRMSEVPIYLIRLEASRTLPHSSHSPSSPFHLSSSLLPLRRAILLAGDITQWHLPVGMKDLNLGNTWVTGKTHLIIRE